jgi:CTD small phosphatase-like protein 2
VFTASEQEYADPIIDLLDPEGKYFSARFYRTSCVRTREPDFYVKDLRIFHERKLSDIVLVDNSVFSFAFQLDNGIPIVSYFDDARDEEMLHLKFYLQCLAEEGDVRFRNQDAF